jgi:hypothetical protein
LKNLDILTIDNTNAMRCYSDIIKNFKYKGTELIWKGVLSKQLPTDIQRVARRKLITALKLGRYFNTSPDFWIGLQKRYDLENELQSIKDELEKIEPCLV